MVGTALEENTTLRVLRFERVPLTCRGLKQLIEGIKVTKSLRELAFSGCKLNEEHLEVIKGALAEN